LTSSLCNIHSDSSMVTSVIFLTLRAVISLSVVTKGLSQRY
jgi:hypothetical protein